MSVGAPEAISDAPPASPGAAGRDAGSQDAAGQIIVGHTTSVSVRIWVQGSRRFPSVRLRISRCDAPGEASVQRGTVFEASDFTTCFEFHGLEASTEYRIDADFSVGTSRGGCGASALFKTFPPEGTADGRFSFLLGSCSLSVVAINNLAAQAMQLAGFSIAEESLRRRVADRAPPSDDPLHIEVGRWAMRRRWCRWLLKKAMRLCLGLVFIGTGGKWPRQPMLKSPYRKIVGMFAAHRVAFVKGCRAPRPGATCIGGTSGATGTVAFEPVVESGGWDGEPHAAGFLVLTEVTGTFQAGEPLMNDPANGAGAAIAEVAGFVPFLPEGLSRPAFTIHAGDQIYFDFPRYDREPQIDSYRDTYREAWFEDRFERYFLSRGAHYMTMDDHEIVDEFATDIELPRSREPATPEGKSPDPGAASGPDPDRGSRRYLKPATQAYREYVHSRQPGNDRGLFYDFRCGAARFFVTDTRTGRRRDHDSRMMAAEQLEAFKDWLRAHPQDLKFVVSSVPFVAEVVAREGARPGRSREQDKWCGPPFRWQRDEIIDVIDEHEIERVVFLVGDMHCAYHASMYIGTSHRWMRRTVHELAGGPVNQLEYGQRSQFADVAGRTRHGGLPYEVRMHQFHSGAGAMMHIEVDAVADPGSRKDEEATEVPEIAWRVVRTMTDPDVVPDLTGEAVDRPAPKWMVDYAPIAGRITLGRRDGIDQLPPW